MKPQTTTVQLMVASAATALIDSTEQLCALDSVAGDGDHGFAMAAASRAILARLDTGIPDSLVALIDVVGHEFAQVGGSMGALLSVAIEAVRDALPNLESVGGPRLVNDLLSSAEDAITDFGGAHPGDKTIVDAIDQARRAASNAQPGEPLGECLRRIADAAGAGAESTSDMPARIGRASRLGDIALGSPDAGATSFAIVMDAFATAYANGEV